MEAATEKKQEAGRPEKPDKPKKTTIIVNGQKKTTEKSKLSFEDLVSIAHDGNPPTGDNWEFTVTYRKGPRENPEGSLLPGQTVKIKERMVFDVRSTDKS